MQITRIHVADYLGIRNVDLALRHPVTLIAGANGAGKSSLAEALRLALCAESVRVGLKKEYGQLVHRSAKAASITVERDGCESVVVSITAAGAVKHDDKVWQDSDPAMPFVLDAGRFARCDRDARSNLLFDVMDVATDAKSIERRLLARDCAPVLVTQFAPILRAGFEHACKEATKRVSEARGAWKAVTGETYGEVKAKTWKAAPGDWKTDDAAHLHGIDGKLASLESSIADAQRRLGAAESESGREKQYAAKLAELRTKAQEFAAHQDLANRAEAQLEAVRTQLVDAKAAAGEAPPPKPKTCACPACGVELVHQPDGRLAEYQAPAPVAHDPDAASTIPGLAAAFKTAETVLARHVANRNAAERAAAEAKLMEDNAPTKPADASSPESIRQTIGSLSVEAQSVRDEIRGLKAAHDQFEAADRQTKDARKHHADLCAWSKIAEALAPDGIPGELLSEALSPINERLAQSAADAGWKPVRIAEDMAITADGREYRLLSESERWRCDALICEAIAHLSELRVMVLDRFDVLDLAGRSQALGWLDVLGDTGEIDSAIVLGTLKGLPPSLPATIGAHWIAKGVIEAHEQQPEEQAA